jgi:hypothetical protein
MTNDIVNYPPLVNTMTTSIARADLIKFLRADRASDPDRVEALALDFGNPIAIRPS